MRATKAGSVGALLAVFAPLVVSGELSRADAPAGATSTISGQSAEQQSQSQPQQSHYQPQQWSVSRLIDEGFWASHPNSSASSGFDAYSRIQYGRQHEDDLLLSDLISWVKTFPNAFISDKFKVAPVSPGSSLRGAVATQDIAEGETLVSIPWKAGFAMQNEVDLHDIPRETLEILMEDGIHEFDHNLLSYYRNCVSVDKIYAEMVKEDPTPYGVFLKSQERNYIPSLWSDTAKKMLYSILPKSLPPMEDINVDLDNTFWDECQDFYGLPDIDEIILSPTSDIAAAVMDDDGNYNADVNARSEMDERVELYVHAWQMLTARGDAEELVPVYDLFNHGSGDAYNTKTLEYDDDVHTLVASRDIRAGEVISNNYNVCNDCEERTHAFGTPEIFQDYGFVEDYPQRFIIFKPRIKMEIRRKPRHRGFEVEFLSPLSQRGVDYMQRNLEELQAMSLKYDEEELGCPDGVSKAQWNMAWDMHNAYVLAFKTALKAAAHMELSDEVWKMGNRWNEPGKEYAGIERDPSQDEQANDGEDDDADAGES